MLRVRVPASRCLFLLLLALLGCSSMEDASSERLVGWKGESHHSKGALRHVPPLALHTRRSLASPVGAASFRT